MSRKNSLNKSFPIGRIQGLSLHAKPSALFAVMIIWTVFTALAVKLFKFKLLPAFIGGFIASILHFFSEGWHQLGHARMAEQTGYPMQGVKFWGPLATSQYPKDEGMLSAEVHIQRALGGPFFSLILTLFSAIIALIIRPLGGIPLILAYFTFLDNLLIFTVGAFLPLGFTDGSTILQWWGHRRQGKHYIRLQ